MNDRFRRALMVLRILLFTWTVVLGVAGSCPAADEHPVSIINADLYVNRYQTTMRLKFFVEDLSLIQGMEPDDSGFYDRATIDEYFELHRDYLLENIQLRDVRGELIPGKIVEVNDSDVPENGIASAELMNYSLGMVVEYKYEQPPDVLTLSQDVADPDYLFPSEMKVLVKQVGRDSPQATMLKPTVPETFRFEWSGDIPSEDVPEEDWAKWFDEQREKDLGIASYSSTYSFIYIDRFAVRQEILVPLASLTDLKFNNADPMFLEVDEQQALRPAVEEYFVEGNPVHIDGVPVKPLVERVDFYGADVRDFVRQADPMRVSVANGRVGIMLRYPTKGVPDEVVVQWDRFSKALNNVEVVIFPFDKAERTQFARYLPENQYVWRNPGTPPLPPLTEVERTGTPISRPAIYFGIGALAALIVGLGGLVARRLPLSIASGLILAVCGGFAWQAQQQQWPQLIWPRPQLDDNTARSIFEQLHKNIFRAFDYHDDEDIYDALAASVDGPLLRELNLQIQERLKMADQGGARSRIDEVTVLEGRIDPDTTAEMTDGFAYRCKWNLVGSVEHWGHIHQRSIVYEAEFQVAPRERSWKITSMDIVHEEPPEIKISVRKM